MDERKRSTRDALVQQGLEVLKQYEEFGSEHLVRFSMGEWAEDGQLRIKAHLVRRDGVAFADSADPLDQKLAHLKNQDVLIRPFFLPMAPAEWNESEANDLPSIDFDYAVILGYGRNPDTGYFLKKLYFLPTDALLIGRQPDEDGVWRKLPLSTYYVHQMSLDPRHKFARFLYLVKRICEAMDYQYDKCGWFYSAR